MEFLGKSVLEGLRLLRRETEKLSREGTQGPERRSWVLVSMSHRITRNLKKGGKDGASATGETAKDIREESA